MLKKLQNLLFEEDDDMEDEEEEIEEKPKRVKKEHHVAPEQQPVVEPVAPAPVQPAPVVRNEQPSFNNIDVNQPVAEKPVEPSFDSLFQKAWHYIDRRKSRRKANCEASIKTSC